MAVTVQCPQCRRPYGVTAAHAGKTIVCAQCQARFTVSSSAASTLGETASKATVGSPAPPATVASAGKLPAKIGRFDVRGCLGSGAFGAVYRAHDPQLDREVALKVPHPATLQSPQALQRFMQEARAAAKLHHPNIVPIYEIGQDGDLPFIVSAFIDGRTLAQAIDGSRPDFRQAARIVAELADALTVAHAQGIIHRDIKPANIMLDRKGTPLLMDFGLAHRADATAKLTQSGAILGTPAYMSPEQASGQPVLPASDQYSVGVVLYELLCGQTPFNGPPMVVLFNISQTPPRPPRSIRPEIPEPLEHICLKAMAKQPEERYASCQDLAKELRRWLAGTTAKHHIPPALTVQQKPAQPTWMSAKPVGTQGPKRISKVISGQHRKPMPRKVSRSAAWLLTLFTLAMLTMASVVGWVLTQDQLHSLGPETGASVEGTATTMTSRVTTAEATPAVTQTVQPMATQVAPKPAIKKRTSQPRIKLEPAEVVTLQPGKQAVIEIEIERDGLEGEVALQLNGLPASVKEIPPGIIPFGQARSIITLHAAPNSPDGKFEIHASAQLRNVQFGSRLFLVISKPGPTRLLPIHSSLQWRSKAANYTTLNVGEFGRTDFSPDGSIFATDS